MATKSGTDAYAEMPTYARSLQTMLLATQQAIAPRFRAVHSQFGLTSPQWRALRVLWAADGQSITSIAEGALLDQPVVVGVVDRLERAGLVTRRRSEEDRRRVHVYLTEAGRAVGHDAAPKIRAVYENLKQSLTAAEWETLFALLERIRDDASRETGVRP